MTGYEPAKTGYASMDDFPPLTDEQCRRVATLLSLSTAKPEEVPS